MATSCGSRTGQRCTGYRERTGSNYFRVSHWATYVGKKRAGRLLDGREWNEVPR